MPCFSCKDLTVELPGADGPKTVVRDVSFTLDAGEVCDLAGPSGSGKTTVLLACALMVPRTSGTLELDGKDCSSFAPDQWRKKVCLVPQRPEMVPGTVEDNLLLPWKLAVRKAETPPDAKALRSALDRGMLQDVELERDASQLSGGQTARICLLRALLTQPDVLLLDEADAALDSESALAISEMTREQARTGAAIMRIRHREPDGVASRTIAMSDGRLLP